MERMLGCESGELIAVHIPRLHPGGADSPALLQIMESLQAGGWSGEVGLLQKQGHVVPTAETAMPAFNEANAFAG